MSLQCKCKLKKGLGGVVYHITKPTSTTPSSFTPLALRSYQSESNVTKDTKQDVIRQDYVNDFVDPIEAYYALPIEKNMSFVILNFTVDGEKMSKVLRNEKMDVIPNTGSNLHIIEWPSRTSPSETNIFKWR